MQNLCFFIKKPLYWLIGVVIFLLFRVTFLPYLWQLAIGRRLGNMAYYFIPRRRKIAEINLRLCFPSWDQTQRNQLLQRHFESLGMGLFDMLNAWRQPDAFFETLWEVEGIEHLEAALAMQKGLILLTAHFSAMEVAGRFLRQKTALAVMYRRHENEMMECLFKRNRELHVEQVIYRDDVRSLVQWLKLGKAVWYATDQNYGHKHSVFAPFFGIPAASNMATSRLAEMTGALVLPFFTHRLDHQRGGYRLHFYPPFAPFPSGNLYQDAEMINLLIENHVRQTPEQYFWVHRRFKDRPMNEAPFY